MSRPLVSIIVPCFNAERYIGEAIESALGQTYPHSEVIVVDDGSSDRSREVVESFPSRVRLEKIPHCGAPVARNRGLELAKGEFVKFLDADDVLLPNAVEGQLSDIGSLPRHAIPYGLVLDLESGSVVRERDTIRTSLETTLDEMVLACWTGDILISAPLHRAEFLRDVNGFDPSLRRGQEWNLHLRLALNGVLFVFVERPIFWRRTHDAADRISIRTRGLAGVQFGRTRWIRSAEAVAAHYGDAIPPILREKMFMRFYLVGNSFSGFGCRADAEEMFALARGFVVKTPRFGRLPSRIVRAVLGPYRAERVLRRLRVLRSLVTRRHSGPAM